MKTIGILGYEKQSVYRVIFPMMLLKEEGYRIIHIDPPYSYTKLIQCDVIYCHKPTQIEYRDPFLIAKNLGIPVWLDYDDNVLAVPRDHPAYEQYKDTKLLFALASIASLVTVSTPALKEVFMASFGGAIPVALASNFIPFPLMERKKEPLGVFRIGWRGGRSHYRDLISLQGVFNLLANYGKNVELHTWGISNEKVKHVATDHDILPPFEYFDSIRKVQPHIMLNSWEDIPFNKTKSEAIWLESMMLGAVLVTSRHEIFEGKPNVIWLDDFAEQIVSGFVINFKEDHDFDVWMRNAKLGWSVCASYITDKKRQS